MNVHTPVRQLMSKELLSVRDDAPISEVRRLLRTFPINHVPIVSAAGKLVGILSSVDLAMYALDVWVKDERVADAELDASFELVSIMTHEPATIAPHDPIQKAAMILADGEFHSLPVVEADGVLVGMLTSTDLLRFYAVQPA